MKTEVTDVNNKTNVRDKSDFSNLISFLFSQFPLCFFSRKQVFFPSSTIKTTMIEFDEIRQFYFQKQFMVLALSFLNNLRRKKVFFFIRK